jgi:hypothetical protein
MTKRRAVLHMALCMLGIVAAFVPAGCKESGGLVKSAVPWFLYYSGNIYMSTGVTVASVGPDADIPSKLMYVGQASLSATDNHSGYSVYLIRGLDDNEAIATRFVVSGGGYWYAKYDRLYGQAEPADIAYNGANYKGTDEIVDFLKVGSDRSGPVNYLSSVTYQGITYDVYSIYDRDENQEIAVRIAKAGKTVGFYSLYFKYVRE